MSGNFQGMNKSLVLLLMIMAIILAVGVFMAIMVVNNRPTPSERTVNVNGEFVTLEVDPNNRPIIQPDAVPAAEEAPAPETVVVEETEVTLEEQPTAVPEAQPQADTEAAGKGGSANIGDKYIFTDHVVQPQDTLYSLAMNNNTTIALLARFGTAKLIPGQTVVITTANPNFCPGKRTYIVEEWDTAFAIANRHGITVQQLAQMNGYPDGNMPVYVTDVICVP
ncbi:MAG TPA: LysM peptidoglycan-binding domain-containing protein [Anaerolineae bacterium]|nr:LysM peptidoglycan-binding domain-containing protein [Anaerolineae bacterium]HIP70650.1 LysM peptidoglycan-binding domain-containing protein [Anaerolineae bacterium]